MKSKTHPRLLFASSFISLAIATGAQARDDYFWGNTSDNDPMNSGLKWAWDSDGSGDWNSGPGTGDVAQFGNWHGFFPSDGGQTYSWAGMRFYSQGWTMNTAAGGLIALNGVSNDWIIKADFTGGGNNVINSPLALNMNDGFIDLVGSNSTLTLNGVIQNGTGTGLGIRGTGTVFLVGYNTYTGATTVNGGTLALVGNPLASTSGVFINNGGTVLLKNNNALGNPGPRAVTISSGGFSDPTYGSYALAGDVTVGTGTSTISANNVVSAAVRTFAVASGGTLNVTGTLSNIYGALGLNKAGAGTMNLSGANTYDGDTTVTGGSLAVNGSSIKDTNKLVISGGTVNLTGAETVNTLFFGAVQQAAGTYSATGAGGTIASANLTGSGNLVVTSGPATGFTSWAATPAFGLAPGDQGTSADPDNDSMDNLLEYALNGNPAVSDPTILPALVLTATDFEFTYSRLDASQADTIQTFEYGSTLVGWTPVLIPAGLGVSSVGIATVTIINTGATDSVKVSIPRSASAGGKLFGRLKVVK